VYESSHKNAGSLQAPGVSNLPPQYLFIVISFADSLTKILLSSGNACGEIGFDAKYYWC
jgi:hypothetical protein